MGILDDGLPRTVEVGGAEVPVRTGYRRGIRAAAMDRTDADDRMVLMVLLFGEPDEWPEEVLADQRSALAAGLAWLDGAWSACTYGSAAAASVRRTYDFDADAAITASDFQRLYGIDLLDDGTSMHWWRFVALLSGAMRTEGTLTAQAVGARSPMPEGAKGRELKRLQRMRKAWDLPPNEAELRARAIREFGG